MRTSLEPNWWKGVLPEHGGVPQAVLDAFAKRWPSKAKWVKPHMRLRVQKHLGLLPELLDGRKRSILDVGCGTGQHLAMYRYLGHDVYGVDRLNSPHAPVARALNIPYGIFTVGKDLTLRFGDKTFDVVQCLSVLIEPALRPSVPALHQEFIRILKDDGVILVGWWKAQSPKPQHWEARFLPPGCVVEFVPCAWPPAGHAYTFARICKA